MFQVIDYHNNRYMFQVIDYHNSRYMFQVIDYHNNRYMFKVIDYHNSRIGYCDNRLLETYLASSFSIQIIVAAIECSICILYNN